MSGLWVAAVAYTIIMASVWLAVLIAPKADQ